MDDNKIKYIKKVAKTNQENIRKLTEILNVLDNIRTTHANTYDDIVTDNDYDMWYSEKNLDLMKELFKQDCKNHILYTIVYIRLNHEGVFDGKNRVYNGQVLSIVYECTYDLIDVLGLWKYCTPAILEDLCI